ncbi:MAG: hypothetical protein KDJ88_19920 [Bauldia sp.]|nr:hypothetical protein [Bauldia sp.]
MAKLELSRGEIVARLKEKLGTLVLGDASSIYPDVYRIPRREADGANWECSFTGVPASELRIVQSAVDLLRREIDLK